MDEIKDKCDHLIGYRQDTRSDIFDWYFVTNITEGSCKVSDISSDKFNYCPECGEKIDWDYLEKISLEKANKETVEAMQESEALLEFAKIRFKNATEMFKALGI